MDIGNDDKLIEWLDTIEAKEATRKVYIIHMTKFCECVGRTPSQLIDESITEIKEGKLPAERKAKGYVAKFKKCLSDQGYAPNSRQGAMAALKSFFKSYDMPLSQSIARSKNAQTLEGNNGFLKREDIIKLIANAKNLREKAIILCMATSGMAIREIIDLKVGEIEIDNEGIGTIRIRREKSGVDYTTFISPEASAVLRTYWDERNRNSEMKIKSKDDFAFVTYGYQSKGKQLDPIVISQLFHTMGSQLGYENENGFVKSRSHALRKYFASTLEDNGFPKPKIDFMMGHTVSSIDKAYFNRDPSKLKELYKLHLPYLTFEKTIEVRSLDTKDAKLLDELKKENEKLKHEVQGSKELKERLDKRDAEMEAMKAQMAKLMGYIESNAKEQMYQGGMRQDEAERLEKYAEELPKKIAKQKR